jgi:hypothetical protein
MAATTTERHVETLPTPAEQPYADLESVRQRSVE